MGSHKGVSNHRCPLCLLQYPWLYVHRSCRISSRLCYLVFQEVLGLLGEVYLDLPSLPLLLSFLWNMKIHQIKVSTFNICKSTKAILCIFTFKPCVSNLSMPSNHARDAPGTRLAMWPLRARWTWRSRGPRRSHHTRAAEHSPLGAHRNCG